MGVGAGNEAELEGFTPMLCSRASPFLNASLAYSVLMSPGFFGTRLRLPRSQISKPANSSFGASDGCCSLVPLPWVTSKAGSQRARLSAHSFVIGLPSKVESRKKIYRGHIP